jgi:hypothetical protein
MRLGACLAASSVCSISFETAGTVVFAFIAVRAVRIVTRVALAHGGPVARPAGLADSGVSHTADAVGVSARQCQANQHNHSQ